MVPVKVLVLLFQPLKGCLKYSMQRPVGYLFGPTLLNRDQKLV